MFTRFKALAVPTIMITAASSTFFPVDRSVFSRRLHFIKMHIGLFILVLLAGLLSLNFKPAQAAETVITAARVGVADYYTRITLESNQPIQYELGMLVNPGRVFIDLENVTLNQVIKALPEKINPADPLIAQIRYGRFKPHVVRLVFDLKTDVVPRAFTIKPRADHGHLLVLDIYYPDKAAIADSHPGIEETEPEFKFEHDEFGQFVATLLKKKPARPENTGTNKLPKSFHAAQYHKPTPPRIIVVAIDPGHGGHDPGAVAKNGKGTLEKDITLAISRKLKVMIDETPNMRAVLTRTGDYYLDLNQRQAIARKHKADLFVSIHADGSEKVHPSGSSVYTLSEHGATSTTASWLARQANSAGSDLVGGVNIASKSGDMREIILDLSMSATINDSVKAAEFVLQEISRINRLHKKTVEQAGFVVLKSPDIPSILVETAFITNPHEEKKLIDKSYQKKMANAIFSGIKNYFDTNPALARTDMAHAH
ncbi:MAG: N-acetylmuramoyl-L-alanine amidase [Nitrosomonas sp.]|nr:N-acetylmuramoyl-L-alanine amidase [Nitrosomonas sp.]